VSDRVLSALQGGVLTGTLNRPDKRNAIDAAMIDALLALLERADLDAEVRVVALRGAGVDFCAGMDLHDLLASADKTVTENREAALNLGEIFVRLRQIPKPGVALLRGRALAGGRLPVPTPGAHRPPPTRWQLLRSAPAELSDGDAEAVRFVRES